MDDLIKDGKNNKWVVCKFCESKVLKPRTASYEEREVKAAVYFLRSCARVTCNLNWQTRVVLDLTKSNYVELWSERALDKCLLIYDQFGACDLTRQHGIGFISGRKMGDTHVKKMGMENLERRTNMYVVRT